MIKKVAIAFLGTWLLLSLAGCSGSSSNKGAAPAAPANISSNENHNSIALEDASFRTSATLPDVTLTNTLSDENHNYEALEDASLTKNIQVSRMIIKNAYVEIEAEDSAAFHTELINRVNAVGGYESSYTINNHENYSVIEAEVRIPADKFDEIIDYIRDTGMVINNRMNSEDITDTYFDTKTRLETTKATLQTYYNLLERASTVEEIIQLQKTIDDITVELEVMEGKLRLWGSQVNLSTLNLLIRQHNDPIKIKQDINWNALSFSDMGYLMARGLSWTIDTIAVLIQWMIIVVVSLSPVLAIAAVGYYFFAKKIRVKSKSATIAKPSHTKKSEITSTVEISDKKDDLE